MKAWQGKKDNTHVAQEIFARQAQWNSLASMGEYMEKPK
jgi:hypothetical protein